MLASFSSLVRKFKNNPVNEAMDTKHMENKEQITSAPPPLNSNLATCSKRISR